MIAPHVVLSPQPPPRGQGTGWVGWVMSWALAAALLTVLLLPCSGAAAAAPAPLVLDLQPGRPHELLLRVDTAGALILPMTLGTPPEFHARALAEQMLQGLPAACRSG